MPQPVNLDVAEPGIGEVTLGGLTASHRAQTLVDRFARLDARIFEGTMERAETLASDPSQQVDQRNGKSVGILVSFKSPDSSFSPTVLA